MLMHNVKKKLKRGWLNIKNATAAGIIVLLITASIIGAIALVPVMVMLILAIIMVIVFKFVYEQYSRKKRRPRKRGSRIDLN